MIRQLAIALAALALLSAAWAQPRVLDSDLDQVANPCLVAAPDGRIHLFALGTLGDSWAAIHRTWTEAGWSAENVLDVASAPLNDPALAVGEDGTVHAVWSEDGQLMHAALSGGAWSLPTDVDGGVGNYAEFPTAAARPDGSVEIAWQTLDGSEIRIAHVTVTTEGQPTGAAFVEAFGASGYTICPQIFLAPTPILCWYEASEGNLVLRAAEQVPGPQWRAIPLNDLLLIEANRLPQILLTEMGEWAALWTEAAAHRDRILLGFGGSLGFGEIVDANPSIKNATPTATVLADGRFAVAWQAESDEGTEIFLALETATGWEQSPLTDGLAPASAQPAIATADGAIHTVWVSDLRDGGDGALSHVVIPAL